MQQDWHDVLRVLQMVTMPCTLAVNFYQYNQWSFNKTITVMLGSGYWSSAKCKCISSVLCELYKTEALNWSKESLCEMR